MIISEHNLTIIYAQIGSGSLAPSAPLVQQKAWYLLQIGSDSIALQIVLDLDVTLYFVYML